MKDFRIERQALGPVELIQLSGSLDMYSFPRLETVVASLFQQNRHQVLLDCDRLDYIGSAGLGALIGFARQAREHGGDFKLLSVPDRIYKIIELLGFTKVLEIYNSRETALASFTKK